MPVSFEETIAAHRVPTSETPESRQKLAEQVSTLREKNAATIAKLRAPRGGKPDAADLDGLRGDEKIALGLAEQLLELSKPEAAIKLAPEERRRVIARIIELDDKREATGVPLADAETAELNRLRHTFNASRP